MAWGGSGESGAADALYEPLPELNGDDLRRLRAIIGLADASRDSTRKRVTPVIELRDSDRPNAYLEELLEEVDRKLDKLLDGGPVSVVNDGYSKALESVQREIRGVHHELVQLQKNLDRLAVSLFG